MPADQTYRKTTGDGHESALSLSRLNESFN